MEAGARAGRQCAGGDTTHTWIYIPGDRRSLLHCAQFFAIDCEMTGLFVEDRSGNYLDEIEDRYGEVSLECGGCVDGRDGAGRE